MSNISKEDAEKLRKLQLRNIIQKVKDGKTLTAAEKKTLDEASDLGTERKLITQTELVKLYGITRKTFAKWRREGRDVPEKVNDKEDLDAWRSWFAANPDAGHHNGKPRADKESLQCDLLKIKIEQEKIELAIAQGKVFDAQHVKDLEYQIGLIVREAFLKLRNEAPPMCEGKSASQLVTYFDEFANQVLRAMADKQSELWDEAVKKWEAAQKIAQKVETENEDE